MVSNKSRGIIMMLALAGLIITLIVWPYNEDTLICITEDDGSTYEWQMDTLYHPTDSSIFMVELHYYNKITYKIDTVEVIEEDGVRWYTLDTIVYGR